jgi:hypothetical protein
VILYAVTALWPLVVVLWTKVRGAGWAYPAVRRPSPSAPAAK